jgi:hypothetical protein
VIGVAWPAPEGRRIRRVLLNAGARRYQPIAGMAFGKTRRLVWWGEAPGRPYDLTEAVDDPLSDDSDRPESAPSRDAPLDHGSARLYAYRHQSVRATKFFGPIISNPRASPHHTIQGVASLHALYVNTAPSDLGAQRFLTFR